MIIEFKENKPFIEGVNLEDIYKSQATPFYVYSQKKITETYNSLKKALNSEIFFAIKANSNQAILKLMKNLGAGADVVSTGELIRSLKAGFNPDKIIFEGVGKSKKDIEYAAKNKIRLINVESINELKLINTVGRDLDEKINIGIRLNPDINGQTLDKISTGKKTDKFGISINKLTEIILIIKSCTYINLKGISCHIGSQISDISIFEKIFKTMKDAAENIMNNEIDIEYVDLGGGLSVNYREDNNKFDTIALGKLADSFFSDAPYTISFEPGRYLIAKAGIIITKILTSKENGGLNYLITDAGMQTLIRPAMYGEYHKIKPLNKNGREEIYTIAGPICESSDILAKNIYLPKQEIDNYLAICDVGAYGSVMASNYNSRGLPNEILINQSKFCVINKQDNIYDIIKKEKIPNWL